MASGTKYPYFAAYQRHYRTLATALPMDDLYPTLVSNGLLNNVALLQSVRAAPTDVAKARLFLDSLRTGLLTGVNATFVKFLDALTQYGDTNDDLAVKKIADDVRRDLPDAPNYRPEPPSSRRETGDPVMQPEARFNDNSGYGIIGDDVMNEKKRAICCIRGFQKAGTGFIGYLGVDGAALITNHGVIPTMGEAKCCTIHFENAFGEGESCTVRLCDVIVAGPKNFWTSTTKQLDFTVIKLDERKFKDLNTGRSLDITPINITNPPTIQNRNQIFVIQYNPPGMKLSYSASPCYVVGPLLLYGSKTVLGSTGSPVLKEVDGQLVPVALHRGAMHITGCKFGTLISEILNCMFERPYKPFPSRAEIQRVLDAHQ